MELNQLVQKHGEWQKEMGWGKSTTTLEKLALVCSEVGEAVNECRGEKPTENFAEELSDIILRVVGIAYQEGINLEQAVVTKMEKNRERGNRGRIK